MALDYKSSLSRYRRYLQVMKDQPLLRAGVWTALSLILVIVMIVMALKPTLVVIAGLLGKINQDKQTIAKLDEKIVKLQQASGELDTLSSRMSLLDQAMPTEADWDGWADKIREFASQSGTTITDLKVGPASLTGKWEAIKSNTADLPDGITGMDFSVTATGNFDQLRKLIDLIENTRRLNILSSVTFNTNKNKSGGIDLSAIINGTVVYVPQEIK